MHIGGRENIGTYHRQRQQRSSAHLHCLSVHTREGIIYLYIYLYYDILLCVHIECTYLLFINCRILYLAGKTYCTLTHGQRNALWLCKFAYECVKLSEHVTMYVTVSSRSAGYMVIVCTSLFFGERKCALFLWLAYFHPELITGRI